MCSQLSLFQKEKSKSGKKNHYLLLLIYVYQESCLADLIATIHPLQWEKGLQVWNRIFDFKGTLYSSKKDEEETAQEVGEKMPQPEEEKEDSPSAQEPEKKPKLSPKEEGEKNVISDLAKFRCTCYRSGEDHNFSSMEAAKEIGGAIQDKFLWKVQMKGWDIEVVVNINKGNRADLEEYC